MPNKNDAELIERANNVLSSGNASKKNRIILELVDALERHPKQGLTNRAGEPVFALVFSPEDVAWSAKITKKKARQLILEHPREFVDGFLCSDWGTVLESVVAGLEWKRNKTA